MYMSPQDKLSRDLSKLLDGEEWTDVTFIVEGEQVKAHRCILASRCDYFRTLLFGDFAESTQKEIPMAVKAAPFKCILRYLYTGTFCRKLSDQNVENHVDILDLAHQYNIGELVSSVGWDFEQILSNENVHWILNIAIMYHVKGLLAASLKFADWNAPSVVSDEAFASLSAAAVKELLKSDSFGATEIDIFKAVKAWCDKQPTRENADILGLVRWSLISNDDIFKIVQPSGVVSPHVLQNFIEQKSSGKLRLRGIATSGKIPYKVIRAERHIDLGAIHFINYIKWLHEFSIQFVEVSVDSKCWERLSLRRLENSGWKIWRFLETAVRFIRFKDCDGLPTRFTKAGVVVENF